MMSMSARVRFLGAVVLCAFAFRGSPVQAQAHVGKIVDEIVLEGATIYTTDQIVSQLQTRVGKPFSPITAQEDYQRLFKKGWFKNLWFDTKLGSNDKVTLIITVEELRNRIEDIQYRGIQHIGDDELKRLTGIKVGMPMSPVANRTAAQAILRKLHEQGRLNASVRLIEGEKETDTRVIFDIVEGLPVKINDIKFKFLGKTSGDISVGRLRQQINSSRSWFGGFTGGKYDPVQVEFDVVRLQEYYKSLGYLDARISTERTWSADHRTVDLLVVIEEGPRYKIGDVRIEGNKVFEENNLLQLTDLRPQGYYDRFVIQSDIRRLRDYYGYSGRQVPIDEKFYIDHEKPGIVHVAYQIIERPPVRVGEIIVEGNDRTRENVIRRQVPLFPGQILSYPDLIAAEQNLSRLGIFEEDPGQGIRPTVTIDNPDIDEPFKTVRVRVREKPTGSFLLGLGVNSDSGINGSIVINERNFDWLNPPSSLEDVLAGRAFRGAGQELRIEAVPGNVFQRYSVSFREPSLWDGPYSLGISGYYYNRGFLEYNEDRLGGRLTLGRRISQFWTVTGTARAEQVHVGDLSEFAPQEVTRDRGTSFIAGARLGFIRDSRDNYLRPSEGSVIDVGYEHVFGDYNFSLVTAEATKYWTTFSRVDGSGKHVLAFRSQASYAGDEAPVYERFYGGGFRSIRGYSFRGVGPHIGEFNIGGRFAFLNSLEYQIPLVANDNLFAVGFLDSGTIERDISFKNYRFTIGAGLRIAVPQLLGPVPIALDFAVPLNEVPGDKKQLFSFYLGFFN
jgi:outer membrane protein assembly complex protein YaeT